MSNNQPSEACQLPDVAPPSGPRAQSMPGARKDWIAPLIYAGAAFLAAFIFWAITTFTGTYPEVARFGGAMWIFVLMMIVLMPIVIPRVRKRRL